MFPEKRYAEIEAYFADYFEQYAAGVSTIDKAQLNAAARILRRAINQNSLIFCCGNGGSAAISNHLSCDCLKGARTATTIKPRVISLSANVELLTAVANDIGYEQTFSYQLQSLAQPGDVLVAISSSGASANIISALRWARENGIKTIAMTGFSGGEAAKISEVSLHVRAENYGVIEDVHQSLMHILAQYLRHETLGDLEQIGSIRF
jgi:phosphoheptose isomerase